MPLYAVKCACGHTEDIYRSVEQRDDVPDHCGKPMKRVITAPYVVKDIKPYQSMIDGSMITSRKAHKDHLHKHGCVEVGNETLDDKGKDYDPKDVKKDLYEAMHS